MEKTKKSTQTEVKETKTSVKAVKAPSKTTAKKASVKRVSEKVENAEKTAKKVETKNASSKAVKTTAKETKTVAATRKCAPKKTVTASKAKKTEEKKVVNNVKVENKKSVMFVASEGLPFVKTGGLADVIGSLPKELAKRNNYDVSVIMPMYSRIDEGMRHNFTFIGNFNVGLAWRNQYCGLFSLRQDGVTYYFIDNEYYFKRDSVYGCYDDGERFAFFSKAVLDSLGYMGFYPDVLNCNDWQTASTVIYLKTLYKDKFGFSEIKTVFTIHNIEYQGIYGMDTCANLFGFPEWAYDTLSFDGCLNLMKGAIELSDRVTTVSPTYANEIKNSYFANGLESIINRNAGKITGILNGLDLDLYNPETDTSLFKNYGIKDLSGKKVCKNELQKMLGLPERDVPVIAVISRLVSHKGLDLIKCVLDDILYKDVQVIVLGKGDTDYENFFRDVEGRYKGKFRALIAFNRDMASKLYSGADIFLMPSRQEPCGLSQMIACRYGAIPVVRRTGGLADSITPFNDTRKGGNGFAFNNYNAHEMLYVISDAVITYGDKAVWNKLVESAVTSDFSWKKSSELYENLYDSLIGDNK